MSTLRLSHILHKVTDLHGAVADAEAAGFTVHWGSDPGHAHNALVWFETGPFLELYAAPPFDEAKASLFESAAGPGSVIRSRRWGAVDDGWCDYAVETDEPDLSAVVARCREAGIALGPAFHPSRTLPGGDTVTWDLAFPDDADLPFVMSAYSSPQRPSAVRHDNGATEITSITVTHPDPDRHREELARYVGSSTLDGVIVEPGDAPGMVVGAVSATGLTEPAAFGASTVIPAG
ncbi:MAG: VOC family protein [Actinomycetota bacterium]